MFLTTNSAQRLVLNLFDHNFKQFVSDEKRPLSFFEHNLTFFPFTLI